MFRFLTVLYVTLMAASTSALAQKDAAQLWPAIEPFESGYLRVSDRHEIYYELCGNPDGVPVIVLHGGPGGSCSPYYRRFFNPEKFLIVLHDQRGAGRSKPFAEIRENDTWELVEDINRLRAHVGIEGGAVLFGGSWGSTLALAYAEAYPEYVSGLVLRGVFLATQEEIDHFYHGGVRRFFPDVYDRLLASLPDPDRRPLPEYLFELIESDDKETRDKYAHEWARYEIRIAALDFPDEKVEEHLKEHNPLAFARLENYYMANHCFLEEGQLLRDAGRLGDTPVVIVNGRYDVVCPPLTAYRLHAKLPNSKLVLAEGSGHWMGEPAIQSALLEAMREFED
jgi:proline iminopeptidase